MLQYKGQAKGAALHLAMELFDKAAVMSVDDPKARETLEMAQWLLDAPEDLLDATFKQLASLLSQNQKKVFQPQPSSNGE